MRVYNRSKLLSLLTLLLYPLLSFSSSLALTVPPNLPSLPASTTATLTTLGKTYTTHLTRSNLFHFRDLSPGSYLLDVHCRDWSFAPLRVDVSSLGEGDKDSAQDGDDQLKVEVYQTFRGNEWKNKGERKRERPVVLGLVGRREYYSQREGFSPLSLLKNPMILLAGFSMLIIFGMPYLMENMDEETRQELEETQRRSPLAGGAQSANPFQGFDMAAWMAGSPAAGASKEKPAGRVGNAGGGGGGGGGGKGSSGRKGR
ncbi:MAG: hypothetical protein M1837_004284 [Sclerophora amabilis]|nr:MAG: hypothetical protein M1837_004284 [Sclerophora amabilis]